MSRIYYRPADWWFGDCMPYAEEGVFYLFHQRDVRVPEPLWGTPFGWSLVSTRDFVDFEDHGEVIPPGAVDAQDQFIFAGSVYRANDEYLAFYTGFNRGYAAEGRPSQVLMVARSTDLKSWANTEAGLLPPESGYDPKEWRDPFIVWDDEAEEYLMVLGTRAIDQDQLVTGRTVSYASKNLSDWEFRGDFWAPGLYTIHEMPDVFRMGDFWYHLVTEYSQESKTVYAVSRSCKGPWIMLDDHAFDGRAYYAARSAEQDGHRYLFGWVATREGDSGKGDWEWGGELLVHEVVQRPDGSLGVAPAGGVLAELRGAGAATALNPVSLQSTDQVRAHRFDVETTETFMLEFDLEVAANTKHFNVRLFEDPASGDGYEYRIDLASRSMSFDRRPNLPWYRYDNRGLSRPLEVDAGSTYPLKLIVDESIVTLYFGDVALTARAYERPGTALTVDVFRGAIDIRGARYFALGS